MARKTREKRGVDTSGPEYITVRGYRTAARTVGGYKYKRTTTAKVRKRVRMYAKPRHLRKKK
jgi:hypothetical protein